MRRQVFTVSAVSGVNTNSGVFVTDIHQTPFNVGFGVEVITTANYTVQHTFDNILKTSADQATWYPHEFVVAASGNTDGNYAFPVTGIRLQVSGAADGGAQITFIQAGYPHG